MRAISQGHVRVARRAEGIHVKWDRIAYDDATGHWWQCKLGAGEELYVDSLSGWFVASWFSGGHDVEIARHATEAEAKAAAEQWLRVRVTAWETALAQGYVEPQDDGA